MLGPILLIVLVLVLAMLFLHSLQDGQGSATGAGVLCLAVVTLLRALLVERLRRHVPAPVVAVRGDRGPPLQFADDHADRPAIVPAGWRLLPLRR